MANGWSVEKIVRSNRFTNFLVQKFNRLVEYIILRVIEIRLTLLNLKTPRYWLVNSTNREKSKIQTNREFNRYLLPFIKISIPVVMYGFVRVRERKF